MSHEPLSRAQQAVESLTKSKFENREEEKSHFISLYKAYEDL